MLLVLMLLMFTPLIIVNIITIKISENEIMNHTYEHLHIIAEEKASDLELLNNANLEALNLLSSRTQLRISTVDFTKSHNKTSQLKMINILEDAKKSVDRIVELSIYDLNGSIIASTNPFQIGVNVSRQTYFEESKISPRVGSLFYDVNSTLNQYLTIPLYYENALIGVLSAVLTADRLLQIVNEYDDLGFSGEVILANKTKYGDSLILIPLRFDDNAALTRIIPKNNTNHPINQATSGNEIFNSDYIDYRGKHVMVFTKYINQTKWGLIVKIDHDEVFASVEKLNIIFISVIVISLLIYTVTYLVNSRFLANPIEKLTDLAKELSKGNLDKRVSISSTIEIEILANTLNQMAENLTNTQNDLQDAINKLEISQDHLLQSHKMEAIGRLAGGIAHDFNNILTIILGYVELLKFSTKDIETKESITQIEIAAQKAKKITSQLLQISKNTIMEEEIISINKTIDEMLSIFSRLIKENIAIEAVHKHDDLFTKIEKSKFEQIILNLVINASEAMDEGGKLIVQSDLKHNIVIDDKLISGDMIEVIISDTGKGIPKENISRIFDPFFTTKNGGTGLGLAVAYGIINQCKGFITVDSVTGKGTDIKIYLPLVTNCEIKNKKYKAVKSNDLSKLKILIVEDEIEIRNILKRILIEYNIDPVIANDANHAIQLNKETEFDLLVTDIIMPDMDGRVLSSELTLYRKSLKTLFISGYSPDEIELSINSEYLQKPFTVLELIEKMKILFM